jgi:hypothetical protein
VPILKDRSLESPIEHSGHLAKEESNMNIKRDQNRVFSLVFVMILAALLLQACGGVGVTFQGQVQPSGTGINITGGIQPVPTGQSAAPAQPGTSGGPNLTSAALLLLVAIGILLVLILVLLVGRNSNRTDRP